MHLPGRRNRGEGRQPRRTTDPDDLAMRAQVFVGVVGLKRDDLQPPPFARFALQDRRGPLTLQAAADEVIE